MDSPRKVGWLAAYLSVLSILALVISWDAWDQWHASDDASQMMALKCVLALCWGALGVCVQMAVALRKHWADHDFDAGWTWWYLTKALVGAVLALAVYVLTEGLVSFLGPGTSGASGVTENTKSQLGVPAIAFLAGFATDRAIRKIDETSKQIFGVTVETQSATIIEPVENQVVSGVDVPVVVQVSSASTYLHAVCVDDTGGPVELKQDTGLQYTGTIKLINPVSPMAIEAFGVIADQVVRHRINIRHC